MLVLSRHIDESIEIDLSHLGIATPILITVVDIRGGEKVRIGIHADRSIPVHRAEVASVIRQANGGVVVPGRRQGRNGHGPNGGGR